MVHLGVSLALNHLTIWSLELEVHVWLVPKACVLVLVPHFPMTSLVSFQYTGIQS